MCLLGVQQLELASTDPAGDSKADDVDQVFIAFARIFSGRLQRGKKLFVLGPKHDPAKVCLLQLSTVPFFLCRKIKLSSATVL